MQIPIRTSKTFFTFDYFKHNDNSNTFQLPSQWRYEYNVANTKSALKTLVSRSQISIDLLDHVVN